MDTLDLVREDKTMAAVAIKAVENDFQILELTSWSAKVKGSCLPIDITWEQCSCHGGRMWFYQKETNISIELSSTCYNEELGICSPEAELAYYIDNKMIETLHRFNKYVYVVETIGEYTEGKVETRYFDSVESASRFIFEEDGHDVNSEYGTITHQYPNPDMRKVTKYNGTKDGVVCFNVEKMRKGKADRKYEHRFKIFRK